MTDSRQTSIQPNVVHLGDYQAPGWLVDTVALTFHLRDNSTRVESSLKIRKNPEAPQQPLVLDGEGLRLLSIRIADIDLDSSEYTHDETGITLSRPADEFELSTVVEIDPASNTTLMGLYQSSGNFCTQCEAEGFRKITFFPDRPDILSIYTVTLIAQTQRFPILLSNGNLQETGDFSPDEQDNEQHYATWHDPHPKSSYLFALVAGDLACITDQYTTMSGKLVDLHIYVEHHNADKCEHAMRSIINSMRWDEQTYGREYDLDVFNVVAVDDFNMGAMENKGLNIFNSKYVLARPDTATDTDYQGIEGVIGHEYFHNWSGNRVTCRDWFQLSLKEGFTVFRDQEFSADMSARGIKRIQDVNMLRTHQFREDAGPMAHPVRPDQYVEINNFYTLTVYEKGAEVVRMLYNLLGAETFRKGTDLYFSRHDGQAVTTDDFVTALEDASGLDLEQFRLWYSTAGTPELTITESYNEQSWEYTLTVEQHTPDTPGQSDKPALHIPVRMGLIDKNGQSLTPALKTEDDFDGTSRVLHLHKQKQEFTFKGIESRPSVSLLQGFSAPVKTRFDRSVDELCFLMANDPDDFNRWDAAQTLSTRLMVSQFDGDSTTLDDNYVEAFRKTLTDQSINPALAAEILRLPAEGLLADQTPEARPDRIFQVRKAFQTELSRRLSNEMVNRYHELEQSGDYSIEPEAMGKRALRNLCLGYLLSGNRNDIENHIFDLCTDQYEQSNNMTDTMAALSCLCNVDCPERQQALQDFENKWSGEALVMDKWFALQATSELPGTLHHVKELMQHSEFTIRNPNKVRSLVGAFANANPQHFHAPDGSGYEFIASRIIELNAINPQIAARLTGAFSRWAQYATPLQELMKKQLKNILSTSGLSKDVFEIASKSLGE